MSKKDTGKTTTDKSDVKATVTLICKSLFEKSSNDANGNHLIIQVLKLKDNPCFIRLVREVKSRKDPKVTKQQTAARIRSREWGFLASNQKAVKKVLDADAKVVELFLKKKADADAKAKAKKDAKAKADEKVKADADAKAKAA